MTLAAKGGFLGIVTAVGETLAPQGALRVADNVSLRREGALSGRPHWGSFQAVPGGGGNIDAIPYGSGFVYINDLSGTRRLRNSLGADIPYQKQTGVGTMATFPVGVRADAWDVEVARRNLYFASADGVFRISSHTDTIFTEAGIVPALGARNLAVLSGSSVYTSWLANNSQVAYRLVAKRTDANGVVTRSRPSGQILISNTTGSPGYPVFQASYGSIVADEIEVYRTRAFPTTVTPDDEMQLVGKLKITTPGPFSIQFYDGVTDVLRTTTLYTSPSRGGMENANDRPPACAFIELFKGSVFFCNTVGPQRATISYRYANQTGNATGLGYRTATGTFTNGSPLLTSVSNTTGVVAGMAISGAGVSYGAYVVGVAGSTVTMNMLASASAAATPVTFYDALTINSSSSGIPLIPNGGTIDYHGRMGLRQYVLYDISPPEPGYTATMVVENRVPSDAAFTLGATNVQDTSIGSGTISTTADVLPHGISWSSPDEPEHAPPKFSARVGDGTYAILGAAATRDALLIFKEDGIFRVTGVNGNFSVAPLDQTTVCILPMSIRRMRNTVYCLSNLGIVAVEDTGVTVVSAPIQNELAILIKAIRTAQKTTGRYELPGFRGRAATVHEAHNEYMLALGTTALSFVPSGVYSPILVYTKDRGLTTYSFLVSDFVPNGLVRDSTGDPLFVTNSGLSGETATSTTGFVARIAPHGFVDPSGANKLWSHAVMGVSAATNLSALTFTFSGAEALTNASVTEAPSIPLTASVIQLPGGSLIRHPIPGAHRRAWTLRLQATLTANSSGAFVVETLIAEARENATNKYPTHSTS